MPNTREKLIELIERAKHSWSMSTMTPLVCTFASWIADHLIANGVTVQKWIPVKDRLPEHFGQFSVTVTEFNGRRYSDSAYFDPCEKRWRTSLICGQGDKVTHWMPLPEPPKGD